MRKATNKNWKRVTAAAAALALCAGVLTGCGASSSTAASSTAASSAAASGVSSEAVSYTHLTLPTTLPV